MRPHFSLEQLIQKEIKRFDIIALLKLLIYLGYQEKNIFFQSHVGLSSATSFCESIFFSGEQTDLKKTRIVSISVNIGLLGANSPLPDFFRKKMDVGVIDPLLFNRFLSFFDHFVIKNLLAMSMPEKSSDLFSDRKKLMRNYLNLIGLDSVSSLSHLFSVSFPELRVEVQKFSRLIRVRSPSTMLGGTYLGVSSFLGKSKQLTFPGFRVFLKADKIETELRTSWPVEIKKRMKEVLSPLFERANLHLKIVLIVQNYEGGAELSLQSQIGHVRIGNHPDPFSLLVN